MSRRFGWLFLLGCLAVVSPAAGQSKPLGFAIVEQSVDLRADEATLISARRLSLNKRFTELRQFRVPLPDGRIYEARKLRDPWPSGMTEFYGALYESGRQRGWITYVADEEGIEGTITIDQPFRQYQIETLPGRGTWLVEKDIRRDSAEGCGVLTADEPISTHLRAERAPANDTKVVTAKILLLYSPEAGKAFGSKAIKKKFANLLKGVNKAYSESGTYLKFQLAGVVEWTGYEELGDSREDARLLLKALENQESQEILNRYRADLVALVVKEPGVTRARAYQLQRPGQFPSGIPSVYGYKDTDVRTFAHELGHNLGADHEPGNTDRRENQWPYAFGHQVPGKFSSLMAYWNHCDPYCLPWLPWLSNPELSYEGLPLGIANERDNRQVVNNNRRAVASIR